MGSVFKRVAKVIKKVRKPITKITKGIAKGIDKVLMATDAGDGTADHGGIATVEPLLLCGGLVHVGCL